jgi:hypothetical protein
VERESAAAFAIGVTIEAYDSSHHGRKAIPAGWAAGYNWLRGYSPDPIYAARFALVGIFATVVAEAPMARVEKISVALPPEMVRAVRDAVVSGEYASSSEVIRDALRGWTLKRKVATIELDEMRRLVLDGIL